MQITVVGAGVVGLTAAVTLTEAGHDVRVLAAATGDATTSAVAGAIWLPFECGPRDRASRWAGRTRTWLEHLAATTPAAGVAMLDVVQIDADGADHPWWADAVGALERAPAPVVGAPMAWHFRAPRVDPRRHLPWLTSRLARPVELARVTRLADVPGDAVVNATGLGARALAADDTLRALYGQVLVTAAGALDTQLTLSDDRDPIAMFYVIPRGDDEVVIGGCALPRPDDDPLAPDPAIRARIEGQAIALGLAPGRVLRERAGLRPARPTVRVERDAADPRIIHDYGHGGAGYTLARGCALDVLAMLSD
ncbi:MAG TPA: FAD-dependent oxidoreductase [Kofleriaceae bacterium]|nr:FAD-dependent oxidoreductase [Kofleriaceae bacterium]